MSAVTQMLRKQARRNRSPENDFHLRQRAFVIQPFMYHPVRPGETLKSLLWQARVVSDPLANPIMGWHLEYYFFYVQVQDAVPVGLEDTWMAPFWDPAQNFSTLWGTVPTRLENGDVASSSFPDFNYKMYRRIVEEYFREEGEVWDSAHKMSGALALARRNRKDAYESAGANYGNLPDVTINVADGLTVNELRDAMSAYLMLMDTSMGSVTTFEDYLASQGQGKFSDVKRAYRPELIRVVKEWTYPVNTVDPLSGTPTSAVSWSIANRADKDRYFKEPGWIVGLSVARPKTLRRTNTDMGQVGDKGQHWLPQQHMFNPSSGILGSGANARDTRDLFEYGFQFVNWDTAGTYKANNIDWARLDGTVAPDGVYPVETSINTQVWKAAASNAVRQDGRVSMNILTDLPPDMNVGDAANQEPAALEEDTTIHEFETLEDLATEYLTKVKERSAGNLSVKLPNIRKALETLAPNR